MVKYISPDGEIDEIVTGYRRLLAYQEIHGEDTELPCKSNRSDDSEEWVGLNEGDSGWLDGFGADSAIDD